MGIVAKDEEYKSFFNRFLTRECEMRSSVFINAVEQSTSVNFRILDQKNCLMSSFSEGLDRLTLQKISQIPQLSEFGGSKSIKKGTKKYACVDNSGSKQSIKAIFEVSNDGNLVKGDLFLLPKSGVEGGTWCSTDSSDLSLLRNSTKGQIIGINTRMNDLVDRLNRNQEKLSANRNAVNESAPLKFIWQAFQKIQEDELYIDEILDLDKARLSEDSKDVLNKFFAKCKIESRIIYDDDGKYDGVAYPSNLQYESCASRLIVEAIERHPILKELNEGLAIQKELFAEARSLDSRVGTKWSFKESPYLACLGSEKKMQLNLPNVSLEFVDGKVKTKGQPYSHFACADIESHSLSMRVVTDASGELVIRETIRTLYGERFACKDYYSSPDSIELPTADAVSGIEFVKKVEKALDKSAPAD